MRGRLRSHRDGDGFEPLPERDSLVLNVSAEFEPEPEPEPQLDRGTLTPNLTGLAVAEIKKQGALRCRVDGGAERRVWMALTVDGALTMRDHLEDERGPRGRSVLRLASARRCKCQPDPAGTELRLLLWEPDEPKAKGEQAGREYVLSGFKPQGAKPKDRDVSDIEEWQAAFRWFEHRSATLHWQFAAMFGLPAPEKAATESAAEEDDVDEACLAKDDLQEFVINWCEKFHRFGFQIAVAERTEQTADRVVILLRMDDDEVLAHFRQLQIERWQNDADGIKLKKSPTGERREKNRAKELQEDLSIDQLTQQDRIFTMADVLSTRCRLGDIEHLHDRVYPFKPAPSEDERQSASRDHVGNKWKTTSVDPRIIDVMPLKDELWIERMGKLWSEKGGVIQSFRGWRDVIVKRRTLLQETLQAGTDMLEHGVSMAQQTVKTVNSEIEVHLERAHEHMEIARHISDPCVPLAPDKSLDAPVDRFAWLVVLVPCGGGTVSGTQNTRTSASAAARLPPPRSHAALNSALLKQAYRQAEMAEPFRRLHAGREEYPARIGRRCGPAGGRLAQHLRAVWPVPAGHRRAGGVGRQPARQLGARDVR